MLFSILIATYNRSHVIARAVQSALQFCANSGAAAEVIVIDDASADNTAGLLAQQFAAEIAAQKLKFLRLEKNVGVTAARMAGFEISSGHWVIVFDSDDQFVSEPTAAQAFAELLMQHHAPIIFTRCQSLENGKIIGANIAVPRDLDIAEFVCTGTPGECMPAIRRDVLETIPYDKTLRAFEGLTMARQIATFGAAVVSPLSVRIYNDVDQPDRLSGFAQRRRRAGDLARGFAAFLREFSRVMTWRVRIAYTLRYLTYRLLSLTSAL